MYVIYNVCQHKKVFVSVKKYCGQNLVLISQKTSGPSFSTALMRYLHLSFNKFKLAKNKITFAIILEMHCSDISVLYRSIPFHFHAANLSVLLVKTMSLLATSSDCRPYMAD